MFVDTRGAPLESRHQRIVDVKFPLPWLLSTAAALVVSIASLTWQVAGANSRLESMVGEVSKVERRLDMRDERIDQLRSEVQQNRASNEVQNQRLAAIEERIRALGARGD